MTDELRAALERRLNEAIASGDAQQVQAAHTAIDIAMMDCQMKTAARVKEMTTKIDAVVNQAKGAALAARALYIVGGVAGGALIPRLLELLGRVFD